MRTPSFTVAAALTLVGALSLGCAKDGKPNALRNPNDAARFAYGIGFDLGTKVRAGLAEDGISADADLVRRGFDDGLADRTPALPQEEMDRVLRAVHREMSERAARTLYDNDPEFRALADRNAAASAAALQTFAQRPNVRLLEEGVYALAEANGAGPTIGESSVAIADLVVRAADGTEIRRFQGGRLDPRELLPIPGRTLARMRAGDRWSLAFAPAQAYGLAGEPPSVGPNEAIFVDVTISSLQPRSTSR